MRIHYDWRFAILQYASQKSAQFSQSRLGKITPIVCCQKAAANKCIHYIHARHTYFFVLFAHWTWNTIFLKILFIFDDQRIAELTSINRTHNHELRIIVHLFFLSKRNKKLSTVGNKMLKRTKDEQAVRMKITEKHVRLWQRNWKTKKKKELRLGGITLSLSFISFYNWKCDLPWCKTNK